MIRGRFLLMTQVLVIAVASLLPAACTLVNTTEPRATRALAASFTPLALPTSIVTVTVVPPATATPRVDSVPEDWYTAIITDTVAAFSSALLQADFATVRTHMTDNVWLGREPTGISGEMAPVEVALAWLETHWQPGLVVSAPEYVQHYNLVRVDIIGWRIDDAAPTGKVRFHLHSQLGADKMPIWTVDTVLTW